MNLPNRILQIANLFGVIALVVLCVFQWKDNAHLSDSNLQLQQTTRDQAAKIDDQTRTLATDATDLASLRQRLDDLQSKETQDQAKLADALAERDHLNHQIAADQEAIGKFKDAIAQRDQLIQQANSQQQLLANQRNDAINKYNDVAKRYNDMVKAQASR